MFLSPTLSHSPRKLSCRVLTALVTVPAFVLAPFTASVVHAQAKDPGPRAGVAGAGGFYPTLNANEQQFFNQALARFQEVDSVSGTIANENGVGLGLQWQQLCSMSRPASPRRHQCGAHQSPKPVPNPQVALAKLDGATNTVPSFITANGPVREARFVATDGTNLYSPLDGGRPLHYPGSDGCSRLHLGAA